MAVYGNITQPARHRHLSLQDTQWMERRLAVHAAIYNGATSGRVHQCVLSFPRSSGTDHRVVSTHDLPYCKACYRVYHVPVVLSSGVSHLGEGSTTSVVF